MTIARGRFDHSAPFEISFAGNAELATAQTRGDDHCDCLKTFAGAKGDALVFQINAVDLDVGPKIEVAVFGVFDKTIAQLATVCSAHPEIILNRVVNGKELTADLFVLLQYQRVEAQFVTPTRGRQSSRTS